jgi:hypothetical protein
METRFVEQDHGLRVGNARAAVVARRATCLAEGHQALDDSHKTKLTKLHEIVPLKSLDRLRHYTRMMEQALDLMREHLNSLPPEKNPSLCDFWSSRTKDGVIEEEPIKLYVTVLDSEFMGYTKGTLLICADVMVFHLDIVRAERGKLKILAAYLLSH